MQRLDWKKAQNILCIRLDYLGDLVMTLPALKAIKETSPFAKITLLTSQASSGLTTLTSFIDEVLIYEAPWLKFSEKTDEKSFQKTLKEIKLLDFDAGIIFNVYSQSSFPSSLLLYLASVPLRLGYSRENPYQLLTHYLPEIEPQKIVRHEVQRQLDLVASVGFGTKKKGKLITLSPEALRMVKKRLRLKGLNMEKPFLIVHPGAKDLKRQFSLSKLIVSLRLLEEDFQIVLTGLGKEKVLTDIIQNNLKNSFSFANETTLEELAALISLSSLVLTVNTSVSHLSSALETSLVVLYANTNPQHFPWSSLNKTLVFPVPCEKCEKGVCFELHPKGNFISPEQIAKSVREVFQKNYVKTHYSGSYLQ